MRWGWCCMRSLRGAGRGRRRRGSSGRAGRGGCRGRRTLRRCRGRWEGGRRWVRRGGGGLSGGWGRRRGVGRGGRLDRAVERIVGGCVEEGRGDGPAGAFAGAGVWRGGEARAAARGAGEVPSRRLVGERGGGGKLSVRAGAILLGMFLVILA